MRIFKVLSTATMDGVRAVFAQLRGFGQTGDDDGAEAHDDIEAFQPLGLHARPKRSDTLEALAGELGEQLVVLWFGDKKHSRLELEEGEVRLYPPSGEGAMVRMRADGSIEINAASGKDITINGGSAKVARVGDHTEAHTHTVAFVLAAGMVGVTGTIELGDANPAIAEGAEHFKG